MQLDLHNLPADTALLHRLVCDIAATIEHRDSEIDRLKSIIKQLQRAPAEGACALLFRWFALWPRLWLASSSESRPGFADCPKRSRSGTEASQSSIFGIERFECFAIHFHISP